MFGARLRYVTTYFNLTADQQMSAFFFERRATRCVFKKFLCHSCHLIRAFQSLEDLELKRSLQRLQSIKFVC